MSHIVWGLDAQSEDLRALVLLNGYPVYLPPDTSGRLWSTKLNPWIVEGDNALRVRLGRVEDGAALGAGAAFKLEAYRTPHGELRTEESILTRFEWDPEQQELEQDGMTDLLDHRFEVPADEAFGRWAWQDASVFDEGERVAIEALVGKCRQALVQRDADGLLALLSLKFAEMAHALDVAPGRFEEQVREGLRPYFEEEGWQVDAIDYGVVSLVPACEGRIVLVMGHRGVPILQGQVVVDEDEEPPLNPFMMELAVSNLGGTWTVVR